MSDRGGAHAPHLAAGSLIDTRYEVRRPIARGGIGIVYEAQHRITRRVVAIKLLAEDLRGSKEARARLRREALALTIVRHPGFVDVLDAGVCGEHGTYVVLERLDGRSLDGILASRKRLPIVDSTQIALQVCGAMGHAHSQGVLHRDLKPGNFFITRSELDGEIVKIIDLGVAAIRTEPREQKDLEITAKDALVGTLEYMSPEQLFGGHLDIRTDVYAIGISLYECLTGDVPYSGTYAQIVTQVTAAAGPPRLSERLPDIAAPLAAAVEKALAKEPSDRFQSTHHFAQALMRATGLGPGRSALLPPFGSTPGASDAWKAERAIELVRKKPAPSSPSTGMPAPGSSSPTLDEKPRRERQFIRVPYVTPVTLVLDGQEIAARCEELSDGGMLVVSPTVLEEGAALEVRFATPLAGEIVQNRAFVRWIRAARGRCAMGLEFASPSDSLRRVLAQVAAPDAPSDPE